ncbi:MAG: ankyrin repeat domain-containing protein [Rhodobacteraceae bacterium]|nr:ankyrin repeat domain-containing protein [Paracoccaceae bacterium]
MSADPGEVLWAAMCEGDLAALERLKVQIPDLIGRGDCPGFLEAIALCPIETIRWLLDNGADPNAPSDCGFPSLHTAIDRMKPDRAEVIALLLDYGAEVNQRGMNDWTALHRAACATPARRDLIALLLDRGADRAARTRIDSYATAEEEARLLGHVAAADFIRDYRRRQPGAGT